MTKSFTLPQTPVLKDWNGTNTYGQSLALGDFGTPALSTSQPYNNLMYTSSTTNGPMVESSQESPESGIANYAVQRAISDNGYTAAQFVVFGNAEGVGGTSIYNLIKGTGNYNAILTNLGWGHNQAVSAGKSYAIHALHWIQGESDTNNGRSSYAAALAQFAVDIGNDIAAQTGQTVKPYVITYQTPEPQDSALGQFDAISVSPTMFLGSPIYHLPFINGNGLHLTNDGYLWMGNLLGRAFKQLVIDGKAPDCIWPTSAAVANGTQVTVYFRVPTPPLVFDTTNLPDLANSGFSVSDSSGSLTLSNVQVVSGNSVQMTLNRTLAANPVVQCGASYAAFSTTHFGTSIRDSTADTVAIDGVTRNLWHVCPTFSIPITSPNSPLLLSGSQMSSRGNGVQGY